MEKFPKFNFNKILNIILLLGIVFSVVTVLNAATPNPGHLYTESSGGVVLGDIIYGSGIDTLSKISGVAGFLKSTGAAAPAWSAINLAASADVGTSILPTANGGTGIAYFTAAGPTVARTYTFPDANATIMTNPMTTLGDIIYENVTPAATRLAGTISATKQFLTQTGNGSISAAPVWGTIATADVPTLNQNTTGTANIAGGTAGAIPYQSAANATAVLASTATANKVLVSGASAAPTWSTPTFPNASAATRKIIVSNATDWVASTETYAVPGATVGNNMASDGTNWVSAAGPGPNYHTILYAMCSHIAAKAAGTYAIGIGDPCAVSGTGTLYPIALINYVAADHPTVNGVTTKLRVRATVSVNATAPTGNFTVGLYPVTSGAGAAGLKIYTMGTLVTGSAATTVTAPGASSMTSVAGTDFTPPADGVYALAVVTTATIATASLVEINAMLQQRN